MLTTLDSFYDAIYKCIEEKPKRVLLSSFGIYAGILDDGRDVHSWGGKYKNRVHDVLDKLEKISEVNILVSMSPYRSCKGKDAFCKDCFETYGKQVTRLLKHVEKWHNFKWRFQNDSHFKTIIFVYDNNVKAVVGGRNFTNSDWADINWQIDGQDANKLVPYFEDLWKNSSDITETALAETLAKEFDTVAE